MTSSVLEKALLQLGGDVHPGQLACPDAADAHSIRQDVSWRGGHAMEHG